MEKTDVVYVLGSGSNWQNNEIRFSLRSIVENLKGLGNVYVIGEKPDWMQNVIHIMWPDEFGPGNADGNIIRKVLRACKEESLSEQFLFINDDHLILKPIEASEVPYIHKGDMNTFPEIYFKRDYWRTRLKRTRDVLNFKELPCLHYDCHVPILFDKNVFPEVMSQFDYGIKPGYTMKSLYANSVSNDIDPVLLDGQKMTVFKHFNKEELNKRLEHCTFMSFNDAGLNLELKLWLIERFGSQSSFEKNDYSDMYFDISKALKTPEDMDLIRDTFLKHGREKNLKAMIIQHGYNPQMHERILFKLKRFLL
jgi:hypothetical protein